MQALRRDPAPLFRFRNICLNGHFLLLLPLRLL